MVSFSRKFPHLPNAKTVDFHSCPAGGTPHPTSGPREKHRRRKSRPPEEEANPRLPSPTVTVRKCASNSLELRRTAEEAAANPAWHSTRSAGSENCARVTKRRRRRESATRQVRQPSSADPPALPGLCVRSGRGRKGPAGGIHLSVTRCRLFVVGMNQSASRGRPIDRTAFQHATV